MTGVEHGHRCLVGVRHRLAQQFRGQRVYKRLQLHAALADPMGQRAAGDGVTGSLEDGLQPVQREVVQYLATGT